MQIFKFILTTFIIASMVVAISDSEHIGTCGTVQIENPVVIELESDKFPTYRKLEKVVNPRQMVITYETFIGDLYDMHPQNEIALNVVETVIEYFNKLIQIIPRDRKYSAFNYLSDKDTKMECGKITLNHEQFTQERDSDLHLYIDLIDDSDLNIAHECKVYESLGVSHAYLEIGVKQFLKKNLQGHEKEKIILDIIHEMVHILGFSMKQIQNKSWAIKEDILTQVEWRKAQTFFIKSSMVLATARRHFDCPTLKGLPLLTTNIRGNITPKSHWDSRIVKEDVMSDKQELPKYYITDFTAALLEDTGYYHSIDYTSVISPIYGKNAGCSFFEGACDPQRPEFCKENEQNLCDFFGYGKQTCSNKNGCTSGVVAENNYCFNDKLTNKIDSQEYGVTYGGGSKCINSSISFSKSPIKEKIEGKCYIAYCTDNGVQIRVGEHKIICKKDKEIIRIPNAQGSLYCPSNIDTFCRKPIMCHHGCSGNGFCSQGICNCIKGYSGIGCETKTN